MGLLEVLTNVLQSLLCGTKPNQGQNDTQSGYPGQQQQQQQPWPQQPQYQQYPPQDQQYQQPQQQPQQQQGGWSNNQSRPNQQQSPSFGKPLSKPVHQFYNDNAVNSQNVQYKDLRARAHQEGDAMARCFQESHEAYQGGDGARAKELSNEGNRHKAEMERLNQQASDWIFQANNQDSAADELDLHGLYVKEAINRTDEAIVAAQSRGEDHINVIVGKGLHSQGGVAKIKPAIEELMMKHQLTAQFDPHNAGVLVVSLNNPNQGMSGDEIANRVERNDCTIM